MKLREYHAPRWSEPIVHELSTMGERGFIPPGAEPEIKEKVGPAEALVPDAMRRRTPPGLPELSQIRVLRHYLRLSQMTLGMETGVHIGVGTCTMKYSPKVNEALAAMMADVHPLQPEETMQGVLGMAYEFGDVFLREISGMDAFTYQPPGGSAGCYNNALIMRKYHRDNGEPERDEVVTTIFSHPCDAAAPATAGFKVITLYPDPETGLPSTEALKEAVGPRTAGVFVTNPEDTGIFNPRIEEFVSVVHDAGGLCAYDQANANGVLGITRARDAGFDLCHFNLHKTFSSPHGCGGPGGGASGVTEELARFLPVPLVEYDGERYYLDYDRPDSVGKLRPFYGYAPVVLRAYAWVMSLGAEGLREVAEIAVLNNNYLLNKMLEIRGVSAPYAKGKRRIEQVRYSWEELARETGVHSEELGIRAADFGVHYWTSHHPFVVPEPCTLEPTESFSKDDLDEYVTIMKHVAHEARTNPELVKTAPHNSTIHAIDHSPLDDPSQWAMTWRAYRRKVG